VDAMNNPTVVDTARSRVAGVGKITIIHDLDEAGV
jgi:hypothetical protein